MPNRGIEWARIFVSVSNILALLTGLTAFKVGRHDLIRAPTFINLRAYRQILRIRRAQKRDLRF